MHISSASCSIPFLVIGFNRYREIEQCLQYIKRIRPNTVYLAFDGPRNPADVEDIVKTRSRALELLDWEPTINTFFSDINLGCKDFPLSAISWFFDNERHGIVVEDDILVASAFIQFVDSVTRLHSSGMNNMNIGLITACSYSSKKFESSKNNNYIVEAELTMMPNIWGWYSTRDIWGGFQKWLSTRNSSSIKCFTNLLRHLSIKQALLFTLCIRMIMNRQLKAWDYLFAEYLICNNMATINPSICLCYNTGYSPSSTHTPSHEKSPTPYLLDKSFDMAISSFTYNKKYQRSLALNTPYKSIYNIHIIKGVLKIIFHRLVVTKRGY